MDTKHHCNNCPHWYVTQKGYPSGYYNITLCKKYNEQLYYLAGEENKTPHPCNICSKQFSYVPYIKPEIEREVKNMQGMMTLTKKDLIEFVNEKFAHKRDNDTVASFFYCSDGHKATQQQCILFREPVENK